MRKWLLVALFGITLAGCATQPSEQMQQGAEQTASEQVKNDDMKATSEQQAGMREVSGTVAYRERIALPDNAVLKVTLEDVSLADAKAIVIDSQSYITEGKQVPLPFTLSYQESKIDPRHTYNVRAQIFVDNKLIFTSDTAAHVITDFEQTHKIDLLLRGVR